LDDYDINYGAIYFFWRDFGMFQPSWSQGKAMHITIGSRYCSWCGGPKTINHPQVRLKWGETIPSPTASKKWQKDLAFCGLSERLSEWSTIFATINFDIFLFMFPSFAWLFLHVPLRKMRFFRLLAPLIWWGLVTVKKHTSQHEHVSNG